MAARKSRGPARKKAARSKVRKKVATTAYAAATGGPPLSPPPPGGSKPQLLLAVAALADDPALRQAFNTDPEKVMDQFALAPVERQCLYSMSRSAIASLVSAEIQSFTFPTGEFPPTDVNCLPEPGSSTPAYPEPTPGLHRVLPNTLTIGSTNVEVVVHGQSFPPDARVRLEKGTSVQEITGDLIGTYRCSKLRVVVPNVSSSQAGTWNLFVTGNHTAPPAYQVKAGPKTLVIS